MQGQAASVWILDSLPAAMERALDEGPTRGVILVMPNAYRPFAVAWDGIPVRPATDQAEYWAAASGCTTPDVSQTAVYVHIRYS